MERAGRDEAWVGSGAAHLARGGAVFDGVERARRVCGALLEGRHLRLQVRDLRLERHDETRGGQGTRCGSGSRKQHGSQNDLEMPSPRLFGVNEAAATKLNGDTVLIITRGSDRLEVERHDETLGHQAAAQMRPKRVTQL